jgi:predicted pyridoxine 5'-phosphate oxidase superfamily flavin-nucleotide-binding protein
MPCRSAEAAWYESTRVIPTPAIRRIDRRLGSVDGEPRMDGYGHSGFSDTERPCIRRDQSLECDAMGQPYIQHRGGPAGFLRVLDEKTIAFADFTGNRQYITTGNLADNPKAYLFLIDYAQRRRIKIWGEARVVHDDPASMAKLMPEGHRARPEQAILFTVTAWDSNCPQHIPQRF